MATSVILTGLGHQHPEHVIENSFFESLDIGTDADWIQERTGILSRSMVLSKDKIIELQGKGKFAYEDRENCLAIEELAVNPWNMALDRSEFIKPELLICGTSVPDFLIPGNSSLIAAKLGIKCTAMDAQTACSSFVSNAMLAQSLIKTGNYNNIAVFNIERYSLYLDFSDRRNCILFGDGSACSLFEKNSGQEGLEVLDVFLESNPQAWDQVQIKQNSFFTQQGAAVQKFAVKKTIDAIINILSRNSLKIADINYFVGHQANLRMLQSVCKRLDISDEQHIFNVDEFGNQGGAGAPIVLSQNWSRFKKGDMIVCAVVGAGLTWGGILFRKK